MEEKYNGWTNYPTWALDLHLNNTEESYRYWKDRAKQIKKDYPTGTKYLFADEIKDLLNYELEVIEEDMPGWIKDILNYAFEKINFNEIAEGFLED